ncbi:hypothetical protein YTPLAS73_14740 [Nitrosarchaeum sp.]|nr:hypothetical protein YTPLAS73_14740 [Nitrosarchaeum sp.]
MTKRTKSNKILNKRIVYFSGKLLRSKDLTEEQNYFIHKKPPKTTDKAFYIFDLSGISSKYVGDTEKNISKIFERIKNMNGIVIFDEADALFGKRTNVKDAHDRYANLESSYLLKRLEKYRGITFISSNLKNCVPKHASQLDYIVCLPIKNSRQN